MPLYEYECTECKRHTEKIQKFSDPEITQCPHCGGKLERVISAPAIAFKGGGWYADGYGNAKPSATKSDENTPKSDGNSTKSDVGSGSATSDAAKSSTKDSSSTPAATTSSTAAPAAAPAASTSEKK